MQSVSARVSAHGCIKQPRSLSTTCQIQVHEVFHPARTGVNITALEGQHWQCDAAGLPLCLSSYIMLTLYGLKGCTTCHRHGYACKNQALNILQAPEMFLAVACWLAHGKLARTPGQMHEQQVKYILYQCNI